MKDFDAFADTVDRLIQEGQGSLAQEKLRHYFQKPVPRAQGVRAAGLAWRAGLASLGIRALAPFVRPSGRRPTVATAEEKAEYAICLIKIGATEEAFRLLESVPAQACSRANLAVAFAYISQWNYHEARPWLSRYVRAPGLRPYDRLVGKVNLAEALIHDRVSGKALEALRALLHETSLRRLTLMHGKVLELCAQYWIDRRRFAEVDKFLKRAEKFLERTEGLDRFFVTKWHAVAAFLRDDGKGEGKRLLADIRSQAAQRKHWETVRDCDRVRALVTRDRGLLQKLYFGTPHDGFRKALLADIREPFSPDPSFAWQLGPRPALVPALDLTAASLKGALKSEGLLHRLLTLLASDFYRPFRVASVFAGLYPGEVFHSVSAPARVHEAIKRLRQWLKTSGLALAVEESEGAYRLVASQPFALLVPLREKTSSRESSFLTTLRKRWPDSQFSISEVSRLLECSPRTALNYVKEALAAGELAKEGRGPSTRYRLAS